MPIYLLESASVHRKLSTRAMALLDGVVAEWDGSEVVRQRMRESQLLLLPLPLMDEVKITVACGEHNFDALAPLVKRLKCPVSGNVDMHSVPHLMNQSLWLGFGFCSCFQLLCFTGLLLSNECTT